MACTYSKISTSRAAAQADPDVLWINGTYQSQVIGGAVGYSLMVPRDYLTTEKRHACHWNLHGLSVGGVNEKYAAGVLPGRYGAALRAGIVREHIHIFPSGFNWSFWINNFTGTLRAEDAFTELRAHIHATYRTLGTAPENNVISGFSKGARGALYHALKNPGEFGGAHGYGAPIYAHDADFASIQTIDQWGRCVLSPDGDYTPEQRAYWLANSPQGCLSATVRPKLRLVYGSADPTRVLNDPFRALCAANGVQVESTAALLAGVKHNAAAYYAHADAMNMYAFIESVFAG